MDAFSPCPRLSPDVMRQRALACLSLEVGFATEILSLYADLELGCCTDWN
jgi:hypothetical protein